MDRCENKDFSEIVDRCENKDFSEIVDRCENKDFSDERPVLKRFYCFSRSFAEKFVLVKQACRASLKTSMTFGP